MANDLIRVELAGGQHSLCYNPFLVLIITKVWEVLCGQFVLWRHVGMLILRSGEDFLDGTLSVLLLDQALLTVTEGLWTTCLLGSWKWLPLVAPSHM